MEQLVLYKAFLINNKHFRTGETKHIRDGYLVDQLPYYLQIEINPEVEGEVYLIHYNADNLEISDTLHDGVEQAMEQANWEFNVKKSYWVSS